MSCVCQLYNKEYMMMMMSTTLAIIVNIVAYRPMGSTGLKSGDANPTYAHGLGQGKAHFTLGFNSI